MKKMTTLEDVKGHDKGKTFSNGVDDVDKKKHILIISI